MVERREGRGRRDGRSRAAAASRCAAPLPRACAGRTAAECWDGRARARCAPCFTLSPPPSLSSALGIVKEAAALRRAPCLACSRRRDEHPGATPRRTPRRAPAAPARQLGHLQTRSSRSRASSLFAPLPHPLGCVVTSSRRLTLLTCLADGGLRQRHLAPSAAGRAAARCRQPRQRQCHAGRQSLAGHVARAARGARAAHRGKSAACQRSGADARDLHGRHGGGAERHDARRSCGGTEAEQGAHGRRESTSRQLHGTVCR
jgi:hypothetical protein